MSNSDTGTVTCQECGKTHRAEFSHISRYGAQRVFAVVCPSDGRWLVDYYTEEVVTLDDETKEQ